MEKILNELEKFEKIILVGGGTGGHISPIIALHSMLSHQFSHQQFLWIGGKKSEEQKEAEKSQIPFVGIPILKLTTTRSSKTLLYPFFLLKSIFSAYKILKSEQKNTPKIAIFSKGGPGALAIGLAGKILGIPVYIHESDTIPGRSNLQMAKISEKIFLGFELAKKFFPQNSCEVVGQILDPKLFEKNPNQTIFWKTTKKHILVICGSQGAKSVFEAISRSCQNLDAEWIVVLGKLNADMRPHFEQFQNIQILDWLEKSEQNHIFLETDIAITRGSATTLAELDFFDIQKIIIPLPSAAKNHQFFNAKEYKAHGDTLLEQKNLSQLRETIESFL
ncbi:UDP-N-acetylglucosamine--N-acetylmuramyl-(pentapeptide) pyrophosphoryl-undecaprenol N-acetylglucosamine transferase [Candidatus Gracilibacteria bacterium]|nr:UDP-N-acetylglucosamine--N-acetylmuramyl-(pentapeptide) pyrophosphoryl-undecaprenol N-acetylglucosamine transferase [Candidatus Gracilibacteria bacterium]